MKCANCGNEVTAQAQFCGACGRPLGPKAPAPGVPNPAQQAQVAARKLLADIRSLKFSVLFPIESWVAERPWTDGWVQALAFLAFYPVALGLLSGGHPPEDLTAQLKTAAWALGLYFAAIWGALLYRTIKPARVEPQIVLSTFFFTAIIGIGVDLAVQVLPVISQLYSATNSRDVGFQLFGFV